jgi:serine/threonine-protein kinase
VHDKDLEKTVPTSPAAGAVVIATGDPDPDELPEGSAIGDYLVRRTIAAGGGGIVFEVEHEADQRRAAIKVLRAEVANSHQGLVRFQREARMVNLIHHPGIVDIYEFGQLPDGRPYFVMDLLEGCDLKKLISERGRLSPEEVLQIVSAVCSALHAAHEAGVVHRDLKAGNVHVTVENGRYQVKLLDFGIAKLLYPEPGMGGLTQAGTRLGTASAMAPEQIRGDQVDQRTDVYALGVLMYHMLTGRYPFRARSRQEIERMNLEAPAPRPSDAAPVPPAIDQVVLRCMSKSPHGRFPTAQAVAAALREAVETKPASENAGARQAVAVLVDVRLSGELDDGDERLLEEVTETLELAERRLRETSFVVSLQTGTSLLAARLLPDDSGAARAMLKSALDQAAALGRLFAERESAAPFSVDISLHVDTALVRGTAASPQIAGPVVEVSSWPTATEWHGVRATPATLNGLE